MNPKVKKLIDRIKVYLQPKEVQPLSAVNAQSLSYYRKKYSYEEMLKRFTSEVYEEIYNKCNAGSNYAIIKLPVWLKDSSYTQLLEDFESREYRYKEIPDIDLLLIYWQYV